MVYRIEKSTGFFGGYWVMGYVCEGWNFTLTGAQKRIRKLKEADKWNDKYALLGDKE